MLRYADFRLDSSSLKQLEDGSIKVTGQLTHPGIFEYRNSDGSLRREYRPADEVFRKPALDTFALATVTINHPRQPDGQRLVTSNSWKRDAIGHLGESVREDNGHAVADFYIRDADAVARVKRGELRQISCGYNVDYDPTPGTTPEGQRYDGVQRNIRGNHVALLPEGIAPRGGADCVLRLDSAGDEITSPLKSDVDLETLKAKVAVLEDELKKARADAAELPKLKNDLVAAEKLLEEVNAKLAPERLDALVEARSVLVASAKAAGVETAGKSALAIKRAIVAKRTPALSARVDSLGEESLDTVMTAYAELPHPSMDVLGTAKPGADPAPARTDAAGDTKLPTYAEMYRKHAQASQDAWKNEGEKVRR